jgi:transmembrane sensor
MTTGNQDRIYEEAVRWHARLHDPDIDWTAFAAWLDRSPEHQAIYDRVALLDSDIDLLREPIAAAQPANDVDESGVSHRRRGGRWIGGGIAAALAVAVATPLLLNPPTPVTVYDSGPGGSRLVTLKDGSSVRLDSNTRLAISDGDQRLVRLEHGAAYFDIHHDPAHPFAVQTDDYEVRDIGTRFGVSRQSGLVSVAVETGLVNVSLQGGDPQPVAAGEQYDGNAPAHTAELHKVDPAGVASWRSGRLVYDNAPISLVAADISRYSAEPVSVEPAIQNLRLTAVLIIGDGTHLVDEVQALLPVQIHRRHHHIWLLGLPSRR